jgi:hypothetical protein
MRRNRRPFIRRSLSRPASKAMISMAACLLLTATLIGCAESTGERSTSADRALKDPWGYGPKVGAADKPKERTDGFDQDGLKRDLNNVFNP